MSRNARLIAVDDINAKGGVTIGSTKHKLEIVVLDVGSPGEAVKVFERLLTVEKVSIVVDGIFSSVQYALGPVVKGKNALVIWSGGNDPDTTVGVPNAFRNTFDGGNTFMKVSEAYLRKMNVKRVATYGQRGHAEFKKFVEEYLPKSPGFEVAANEWHPFGEKDFFPVLTKFKGMKLDAVITHGVASDSVTQIKQAREIGLYPGLLWINQSANAPYMIDDESKKVMEGTVECRTRARRTPRSRRRAPRCSSTSTPSASARRASDPSPRPPTTPSSSWPRRSKRPAPPPTWPSCRRPCARSPPPTCPTCSSRTSRAAFSTTTARRIPRIIFTQWKDGKVVPIFSDFGL